MAARFVDVSELKINQFKENAQKTKDATKFGVKKLFKGRLLKFLCCK